MAEQVFAPHYAAPLPRTLATATQLTDARDGAPIATLASGDRFEVLELTAGHAWGVAPGIGLVGYVPLATLAA